MTLPWSQLRSDFFPISHFNFNPGTLGSCSPVLRARSQEKLCALTGYPLGLYQEGRTALQACKKLVKECWGSGDVEVAVGWPSTTTANHLTLAVASVHAPPIRVLTSEHEHYGGISGFEHHPSYEVLYLTPEEMHDPTAFRKRVREVRPHLALFSHITWTLGEILPVERWCAMVREEYPECLTVIDAAQSFGLVELPFGAADLMFASAHKWLCGPLETGLLWIRRDALERLPPLNWMQGGLDGNSVTAGFESAGGMDFSRYWHFQSLLELIQSEGRMRLQDRTRMLGAHFVSLWHERLSHLTHLRCVQAESGMVIVHFDEGDSYPVYRELNESGIHVKCIKRTLSSGRVLNLLRLGFPFYETTERLEEAFSLLQPCLERHLP